MEFDEEGESTATASATSTPTPAAAIGHSARIAALIEGVSAGRLFGHVEALAAIPSRHVNSTTIGQAAEYIHDQFEAGGGRWAVSYEAFPLGWNGVPTTQVNVIAALPGSDPQAGTVVIGAHYDSRTADLTDSTSPAPGANDNATGVAALLEIARLLADETPRTNVVLIAFSAEEVGRLGSIHHVEAALARGDDLRAMLALDIVGNAAGPAGEGAIRVFSSDPPDSPSRQLARLAALIGEQYVPGFDAQVQPAPDRPYRYSDHLSFSDAGIPAMRLIEPLEDPSRQHSPLDTPEFVSATYLRRVTQLTLATLASLAWGPDAPAAPASSGDRLAWTPVEGAVGYRVALRAADSVEYQEARIVTFPWIERATAQGWDFIAVAALGSDGAMSAFSPEAPVRP